MLGHRARQASHFERRLGDVQAADFRRPFRWFKEAGEHLDRGRFAGAVRAEEGANLTRRDVEIQLRHGGCSP